MFERLKGLFGKKSGFEHFSPQPIRSRGARQIWPLVEELRFLREKYRLNVKAGKRDCLDEGDLMFIPLKYVETLDVVRIVKDELAKYPVSYVKQLAIKRLRLVENLQDVLDIGSWQMRDIGGMVRGTGQVYSGLEPYGNGKRQLIRNLHHELLHRADDVEKKGSLAGFFKTLKSTWKWTWLNPHAYIGEKSWDGDYYDTPGEGFASFYGMRNINEDRATVTELLMTEPDRARMKCVIDPIFEKKVHQIMRDFRRRSLGLMDTRYFNDLLNGRVTPGYWG